jgi:hypothetical protein
MHDEMRPRSYLTPEERRRIYLEEQVRLEARHEIESRKVTAGKVVGYLALGFLGLLVLLFVLSTVQEATQTPAERARQAAETCLHAWQVRLSEQGYSYEEGKVGAIGHCSAELDRLHQIEK